MEIKCYERKSDVTKLLKKLGSNEKYEGNNFSFEGLHYSGIVKKGDFNDYLITYWKN